MYIGPLARRSVRGAVPNLLGIPAKTSIYQRRADTGMSLSPARKTNAETYAFSWSLPAGGEGSDTEGMVLHSVPLVDETGSGPAQEANDTVQLEEAPPTYASPYEPARRFRAPGLRLVGVLAWSAIAGTGLAGAVMKFGVAFGMQVGEIAGLWLALGAAIWLVPPKLIR